MYIGNNMVWRSIFISFLISGALAQYEVIDGATKNKLRNMLTQECARNQAVDKADGDVVVSIMGFVDCTDGMDLDVFIHEAEKAKKHGGLDEVFRKYCLKSPQLKACITGLVDGISPCIASSHRAQVLNGKAAVDQLLDFVCFKDGDRLGKFTAEDGPECFIQKGSVIEQCFVNAKTSIESPLDLLQSLTLDDQCSKYDELSACVVKAMMDTCPTPTPGNMIESLLRYVRDGLPCKKQGQ